jgi:hypothetical protein
MNQGIQKFCFLNLNVEIISFTITPEKYTEVTKYKTANELASDNGKKHA